MRLLMLLELIASRKCLITVLAHQSRSVKMNFEVAGEVSVVVESTRTQLTLPSLRGVRVSALMFGEVCVSRERFAAQGANVKADSCVNECVLEI
jgi:hypothetical protein